MVGINTVLADDPSLTSAGAILATTSLIENILIIVGSPKNKMGNSESIADCFIDKLNSKNQTCSKSIYGRRSEEKRV